MQDFKCNKHHSRHKISLTYKDLFSYILVVKKKVLIKNPTAPRINFLDFIKGIAITCVIIGHSGEETSLQNIFIFSFHMPIFFIISGFLFADGNSIK